MPGVSTGKSAAGPDLSSTCAEPEMAYHKSKELREISRPEKEIFTYVDFLADFRGTFHDICNDTRFGHCLDRNSYGASQHLARELLEGGSAGVVYPSVRHKVGTCIACFRPALVNNVRKGVSISIGFENAFATPEIREIRLATLTRGSPRPPRQRPGRCALHFAGACCRSSQHCARTRNDIQYVVV